MSKNTNYIELECIFEDENPEVIRFKVNSLWLQYFHYCNSQEEFDRIQNRCELDARGILASAIADQEFSGFEIVHEKVNRGTTRIIEEDALNIATDVLVCPVNPDGVINTEISKRVREVYPEVYQAYIELCNDYNPDVLLGMCQAVPVKNSSKIVCNIFVETESKDCHALRNCLESIADRYPGSNIAIPYSLIHLGYGEAREVIQNELVNAGCNVVLCRPRA